MPSFDIMDFTSTWLCTPQSTTYRSTSLSVFSLFSLSVPWGWRVANIIVLKKVREALGFQQCKVFAVGAAPIKMETMEYFMSVNIPIMNIYGEACSLYAYQPLVNVCFSGSGGSVVLSALSSHLLHIISLTATILSFSTSITCLKYLQYAHPVTMRDTHVYVYFSTIPAPFMQE